MKWANKKKRERQREFFLFYEYKNLHNVYISIQDIYILYIEQFAFALHILNKQHIFRCGLKKRKREIERKKTEWKEERNIVCVNAARPITFSLWAQFFIFVFFKDR